MNIDVQNMQVDSRIVDSQTIVIITFANSPSVVERASGNSLADGNDELRYYGASIFGADDADNFFRKFGDMNGDGFTDFTDFAQTFLPSFGTMASEPGFSEYMDFDGDEDVDFDDFRFGFLPSFGS